MFAWLTGRLKIAQMRDPATELSGTRLLARATKTIVGLHSNPWRRGIIRPYNGFGSFGTLQRLVRSMNA